MLSSRWLHACLLLEAKCLTTTNNTLIPGRNALTILSRLHLHSGLRLSSVRWATWQRLRIRLMLIACNPIEQQLSCLYCFDQPSHTQDDIKQDRTVFMHPAMLDYGPLSSVRSSLFWLVWPLHDNTHFVFIQSYLIFCRLNHDAIWGRIAWTNWGWEREWLIMVLWVNCNDTQFICVYNNAQPSLVIKLTTNKRLLLCLWLQLRNKQLTSDWSINI